MSQPPVMRYEEPVEPGTARIDLTDAGVEIAFRNNVAQRNTTAVFLGAIVLSSFGLALAVAVRWWRVRTAEVTGVAGLVVLLLALGTGAALMLAELMTHWNRPSYVRADALGLTGPRWARAVPWADVRGLRIDRASLTLLLVLKGGWRQQRGRPHRQRPVAWGVNVACLERIAGALARVQRGTSSARTV